MKAKETLYGTRLFEKLACFSAVQRLIVIFVALFAEAVCMQLVKASETFSCKIVLSIGCVLVGYVLWLILLSFVPKPTIRLVIASLMLVIIPVTAFWNAFGSFPNMARLSDMQLLDSKDAPGGDYAAEAYRVSTNEDGSFHGKVYLAYLPTGKKHMYQNTKKLIYEDDTLDDLRIQWLDDQTLLINGERIDVYA